MTDYSAMHWKTLQKECEVRNIPYEGKEQAIDALTALDRTSVQNDVAPVVDVVVPAPTVAVVTQDDGLTFNRNKPYGEVCGAIEEAPGARFCQNGHYFNNAGVKVG